MKGNPYLEHIQKALPRVLAMFDTDRTNHSYGVGDRFYWAWGLTDFGNGTFQGAAHGLARLWCSGLWPYPTECKHFLQRIDALFSGAAKLTRTDGSLEEAFPNEGSFCVTALVAFDLLCALKLLRAELDDDTFERWLGTVSPMIDYLMVNDETHAIISNHLATAVAALVRWHELVNAPATEKRAHQLLGCILSYQSDEGWFIEYEGADPGYQSLCTYYLADIHRIRPDWGLLEPIRKSIRFLWYFAHPDGSFGGLYGSRCTRFYYPAGLEALAEEIPEANALAKFMAQSIADSCVVTLSVMDEANLVPMFNAYCWAASLLAEPRDITGCPTLPAVDYQPTRKYFKQAGLLIDRGSNHYTVVSIAKGGVTHHFVAGRSAILNTGIVVSDSKGRLGSSQAYSSQNKFEIKDNKLEILASISPMPKRLPSPEQFLLLRLLCVTVFRSAKFREWVKRRLVSMLITGAKPWPVTNRRTINLGESLCILDKAELPMGYILEPAFKEFVPIHMASQGYWQVQDECAEVDI